MSSVSTIAAGSSIGLPVGRGVEDLTAGEAFRDRDVGEMPLILVDGRGERHEDRHADEYNEPNVKSLRASCVPTSNDAAVLVTARLSAGWLRGLQRTTTPKKLGGRALDAVRPGSARFERGEKSSEGRSEGSGKRRTKL